MFLIVFLVSDNFDLEFQLSKFPMFFMLLYLFLSHPTSARRPRPTERSEAVAMALRIPSSKSGTFEIKSISLTRIHAHWTWNLLKWRQRVSICFHDFEWLVMIVKFSLGPWQKHLLQQNCKSKLLGKTFPGPRASFDWQHWHQPAPGRRGKAF